ncbi:MAG: DEAD/DEAH box helicase [Thermomicrobiales bacterium]
MTSTSPQPTTNEIIDQFGALYPFDLDPFQREALEQFLEGDSVMVAAPTGTGKTLVAEFGVYEAFRRQGRVIYTTPIKALSNQKFRDLREIYHDQVGLLTGDVTEKPEAPILVMTTEVLRNMLLQTPWEIETVDCVIFDEVHYIADQERGTTWEEAIILCPEHVQLICLSATVSNADEIAGWISRTHRPIHLITHYERAIPLALFYYLDKKLRPVIDHSGEVVGDFSKYGGEIRRQMRRGGITPEMRRQAELEEPQPWEVLQAMSQRQMLPAIYFLFSRRDCEEYAQRVAMMRTRFVPDKETADRIEQIIDVQLRGLRPEDRELEQVASIISLARSGIGFHHAGLLPVLKQLVEVLFSHSLMQVVFATDTLALGVNMPARSVVIGRLNKWDGRQRRLLIPNEFQQMAGRAGRRGMDEVGHVVVPYSPWVRFSTMLEIATGELEPVMSSFAIRYNTVLNLWDPPQGSRVRYLLQQSLAQHQSARRARELEEDIVALEERAKELPHGCLIGYEGGDALLDEYRGFNRSTNALSNLIRTLEKDRDSLDLQADERPWPEPGRQALRRLFRTSGPGVVVHSRRGGWGVFLGRPEGTGGIGLFLFGTSVVRLEQYRDIDYLPTREFVVDVPDELTMLDAPVSDVSTFVPLDVIADVHDQVDAFPLPDLQQMVIEHREKTEARQRAARQELEKDIREARAQLAETRRTRENHPCHDCLRRKEHQNNIRYAIALEKERDRSEQALKDELESEAERIRGLIRGIRDVLHRFGYLHRGYPTTKTDLLADVFDNNGLIICEMIDRGLLDKLSPEDLAEAFSWYAYDRDNRLRNNYSLPKHLVLLRRRLEDHETQIVGAERANGLFISSGHQPSFYGGLRAWCGGANISTIVEKIDLSEGDLVMAFNKTLDLMRQVREMLANARPDHPLRQSLQEAENLVRRDIVEQSLLLGVTSRIEELAEELTEEAADG